MPPLVTALMAESDGSVVRPTLCWTVPSMVVRSYFWIHVPASSGPNRPTGVGRPARRPSTSTPAGRTPPLLTLLVTMLVMLPELSRDTSGVYTGLPAAARFTTV